MSKTRPSDFGSFWYRVGKELAEVPIAPEVESIPMRSTDFADLYGVRPQVSAHTDFLDILVFPKGMDHFQ